jgi:hypothetical protein
MENWKDTCRGSKKNVLTELLKKSLEGKVIVYDFMTSSI